MDIDELELQLSCMLHNIVVKHINQRERGIYVEESRT